MKAVVYTEYGSPEVLKVKEVAKPSPKEDDVLIKVHAAALNAADGYLLQGKPFLVRLMAGGLFKPQNTILGADVAGVVEAVGNKVTQFKPGDEVFGDLSESGWGGFAEYVCAKEKALVLKPANITFQQAAAVPMAAVTAWQGLAKGGLKAGQKVLINGASGGVGTFAVQIAKVLGAEVTAVCSTSKVELMRSIGADHVIDYTQTDFTQGTQRYDLILAANGYHPLSAYRRVLKPEGVYMVTGGSMRQIFQAMLLGSVLSWFSRQKMGNLAAQPSLKDLQTVQNLLALGKITPVIDRCYPLQEAKEGFRYLLEGRARGKVIISVVG